jgi:hypothetical protein
VATGGLLLFDGTSEGLGVVDAVAVVGDLIALIADWYSCAPLSGELEDEKLYGLTMPSLVTPSWDLPESARTTLGDPLTAIAALACVLAALACAFS